MAKNRLKDGYVTLKDGNGASCLIKVGDGNFSYTEAQNLNYDLDRGQLDTVTDGDDEPVSLNFDIMWEWIQNGDGSTDNEKAYDILTNRTGGYTTTSADACEKYSCDVELEVRKTCGTATKKQVYLFPYFRHDSIDFDLENGQMAVTGRCNITRPTIGPVEDVVAS